MDNDKRIRDQVGQMLELSEKSIDTNYVTAFGCLDLISYLAGNIIKIVERRQGELKAMMSHSPGSITAMQDKLIMQLEDRDAELIEQFLEDD